MNKLKWNLMWCEKNKTVKYIYPSKMSYWNKIAMLECWHTKYNVFNVNKKYLEEIKSRNRSISQIKRFEREMK